MTIVACLPTEFQCPDQSCIPKAWRCDGVRDCAFAADEANCTCQYDYCYYGSILGGNNYSKYSSARFVTVSLLRLLQHATMKSSNAISDAFRKHGAVTGNGTAWMEPTRGAAGREEVPHPMDLVTSRDNHDDIQ